MSTVILAIVGSTCARLEDAAPIIEQAITEWKPRAVVSGGAVGVDSYAERIAIASGIPVIVCKPAGFSWPYYKARNQLIAEIGDRLLRIVSAGSKSYGSGWTRDYAATLGKPTTECRVP